MTNKIIFCSLSFIGIFILMPICVIAQSSERIQIERTDSLHSLLIGGQRVNKLIGNVRLRDRNRVFESDSAYHFVDRERIEAWGNIQIEGEKEIIWSDVMVYTAADDVGRLSGNVVLLQDSLTLFSTTVSYNFTDETATFPSKLQLIDSKSVLLADSGIFFNVADSAVFTGNVQLSDSTSYLEGDSLFYKRDSGTFNMRGQIYGENRADSIRFSGTTIFGDSTGYKRVENGSLIEKIGKNGADTTYVQASKLEYFRLKDSYLVDAYGNATVWNPDYSALADTIVYADSLSMVNLNGASRIWQKNLQLSSDRQFIYLNDTEIDSLVATSSPFAVLQDSVTSRFQQLSGTSLTVVFDSSEVDRIIVPSDTQLLYFPVNDLDEPDGAILIRMKYLELNFFDGEIDNMTGLESIDGSVYEEDDNVGLMKLDRFQWEPELRPMRPSQRPKPRLLQPIRDSNPITLPIRYRRYIDQTKQQTPLPYSP